VSGREPLLTIDSLKEEEAPRGRAGVHDIARSEDNAAALMLQVL
jgi:hypothetical protein